MKRILLPIIALAFSSCTMTVYTQKLRDQLELSGISPEKTQFYIANDIQLTNLSENTDRKSTDGAILSQTSVVRNKISFGNSFTSVNNPLPCVSKGSFHHRINMYFETGDTENKKVEFFLNKDRKYQILPSIFPDKLQYDGIMYQIVKGQKTLLYVRKKDIKKTKTVKKTIKGLEL